MLKAILPTNSVVVLTVIHDPLRSHRSLSTPDIITGTHAPSAEHDSGTAIFCKLCAVTRKNVALHAPKIVVLAIFELIGGLKYLRNHRGAFAGFALDRIFWITAEIVPGMEALWVGEGKTHQWKGK